MAGTQHNRMNPWALVAMAAAVIAAAFFFYTDHPVRESNLYSPSVPGWISLGIFIAIAVLSRIVLMRDQKRDAEKPKNNAAPDT